MATANASSSNAQRVLGVVGGSSFLKSEYIKDFKALIVDTEYGQVKILGNVQRTVFFVQRHAADPARDYTPPHLINKKAIVKALSILGCTVVVGFGSVGSLQESLPVGSMLVPNDYVNLWTAITFFDDDRGHLIPGFNQDLRTQILEMLRDANITAQDGGVYVQTQGPRFETPAEIKALKSYSDVVGMTCAHEAALFAELKIPFAIICMVDNMANGIVAAKPLTVAAFHAGVKLHADLMLSVLGLVIQRFGPEASQQGVPAATVQEERKSGQIAVDTLVTASYVVTMVPGAPQVLVDHAVVVKADRIVDVLPQTEALAKYAPATLVQRPGHVLMPGLINAHTHVGMTMLRGYSDDKALMPWLTEDIWPAEAKFLGDDFVHDSTKLAIAEMVRGGTTTFNDMFMFTGAIAQAVDEAKFRALIGLPLIEFPTAYAQGPADYFAKGEAVMKKYQQHPLISFSQAPHAPFTVHDSNWTEVVHRAEALDLPVHTHLHETNPEVADSCMPPPPPGTMGPPSRHLSDQVCRPLANFVRLGLADQGQYNSSRRPGSPGKPTHLIAVHMTQLNEDEIALCADKRRSVHVVHCPASNMKLASGVCPVAKLLAAGANVALGTDSTASNNSLDMFSEMRLASFLAKSSTGDPTVLPAYQTLQLATVNGAKALRMEKDIGCLEVGKAADFIAIQFGDLEQMPVFDVISHLAYCTGRDKVRDVWVAGRRLLDNGRLTTIDEAAIKAKVAKWNVAIAEFRQKRAAEVAQQKAVAGASAEPQTLQY